MKPLMREYLEDFFKDFNIFDSKVGTSQHIAPAAIMKRFSGIDFQIQKTDFYTLPEDLCVRNQDAADRVLTHVESNCYISIDYLLKKVTPSVTSLKDVLSDSSRKSVQSKNMAGFYLYLASLILRSPSAVDLLSFKSDSLLQGYASHKEIELKKSFNECLKNQKFRQFCMLSPEFLIQMAISLSKKAATVFLAENEFHARLALASKIGHHAKSLSGFKQDFLIILSPSVALVLESPNRPGPNFQCKKATTQEIELINETSLSWHRAANRYL